MLYNKAKGDNKKQILENEGVTKITREFVGFGHKVWVLITISLT